ncbi:MAG: glycosyltransferase family 4 protein [bacterium]|nr:glycosyltransferase family 4 protein [bacterium]
MKNVLIISKYFYPYESGSEKTTRYIIDYLAENNFKVTLFCARGSSEKLNSKANFVSLEKNKLYLFLSKKRFAKELADIMFGFKALFLLMRKERYDSVNIHYSQSFGLPAVVLSKLFGTKSVVLWPTSSLYHSKLTDGKIQFITEKTYSFLADAFLAKGMPSRQMRKYFRVRKEKLFETVNPVEQRDYDPGECDFHNKVLGVYYLGKYNEFKRPDILIRSLGLLKPEERGALRISLYGSGNYELTIRRIVKELGLEEIVNINPPTKDVKSVIRDNHVFVYPSPYEPAFSQSILESLGSGRAVICRNTAGIRKYFKDDSIIGVMPMNEENLAKKLSWIISDRKGAEEIARNGKRIISRTFTFENFMNQYMKHI